jgi:hypothetical protein
MLRFRPPKTIMISIMLRMLRFREGRARKGHQRPELTYKRSLTRCTLQFLPLAEAADREKAAGISLLRGKSREKNRLGAGNRR